MEKKVRSVWQNKADIAWIDSTKKVIAFSFDDGPVGAEEGAYSIRIQNVLKQYKMHATFFYWGEKITPANEAEIKRAYELGFEVGNHTYTHSNLTERTAEQIKEEVAKTNKVLSRLTGQSEFLVRPPYGAVDKQVSENIKAPLIKWSVDSRDWDNSTFERTTHNVLSKVQDGAIVLMHEPYESTAQAVEYMVPYLVEQGYQIVSVSELMKVKGISMVVGNVYEQVSEK